VGSNADVIDQALTTMGGEGRFATLSVWRTFVAYMLAHVEASAWGPATVLGESRIAGAKQELYVISAGSAEHPGCRADFATAYPFSTFTQALWSPDGECYAVQTEALDAEWAKALKLGALPEPEGEDA